MNAPRRTRLRALLAVALFGLLGGCASQLGAATGTGDGVFDADVRLMDQTLRGVYGTSYRSILLSNLRIHSGDRDLPLASIEHVDQVFAALQRIRGPTIASSCCSARTAPAA